jgi:putative ABC transport system substrate-binding protein
MNQILRRRSLNRISNNPKCAGLLFFAVAVALCGSVTQGQQTTKTTRVGYLAATAASVQAIRTEGFQRGLQELGYIEGKNVIIEYRYAEGKPERLSDLAKELVGLKADVIIAGGTGAATAAKNATGTIPIVVAGAGDLLGTGLVASLAHPGGNVTGLSDLSPQLSGKRLELLKETFPKITRVAVLWQGTNVGSINEMKAASGALKVTLQLLEIRGPEDLDSAFSRTKQERASAIVVLRNAITNFHRTRIVDLAAKSRLPAMFSIPEFVDAGGLMSYAPDYFDLSRRAAVFVDKILKGTKPADLPVEQPTKFELVINLKTAKQIGLTIPPNVLARADRVIK